jgi:hypothetical protein
VGERVEVVAVGDDDDDDDDDAVSMLHAATMGEAEMVLLAQSVPRSAATLEQHRDSHQEKAQLQWEAA